MTLYKRNKILFIVFIALLFFSPRLCNAADTEESAEEILFLPPIILILNIPTTTYQHLYRLIPNWAESTPLS